MSFDDSQYAARGYVSMSRRGDYELTVIMRMILLLQLLRITTEKFGTAQKKRYLPKTSPSVVLHPTSLPPWPCWNSPKSLKSKIPFPSSPKVLPPNYVQANCSTILMLKLVAQSMSNILPGT